MIPMVDRRVRHGCLGLSSEDGRPRTLDTGQLGHRWAGDHPLTDWLSLIRRPGPTSFRDESGSAAEPSAWLGNTPSVAMRHYLMTTAEHFEAALAGGTPRGVAQKAARNPVKQAHANGRMEGQSATGAHEKTPVLPGFAAKCECGPAATFAPTRRTGFRRPCRCCERTKSRRFRRQSRPACGLDWADWRDS
jgi:hypothetical protein